MTPIVFKITNTGKQIVLDAPNTGLTLRLTHLSLDNNRPTRAEINKAYAKAVKAVTSHN